MPSLEPSLETLPPEIVVRQLAADSVRYVLPLRDLKYGKWLAGLLLVIGLLIFPCTLWTIYVIASSFFNLPAPARRGLGGFAFFFCVFGAPFTWGGFAPFWWGLVSFFGHREIEVNATHLLTVERCGPFWRSKRWKVENIGSFEIKPLATPKEGESPPPIDIVSEFNALLVHPRGGKQGMLAWGYPIPLLVAVAQALSKQCNRAAEVKGFAEAKSEEHDVVYVYGAGVGKAKIATAQSIDGDSDIDEDDEFDDDWEEEESDPHAPVVAPPGTTIRLDRLADGELTITIPPAGVWKGSKGLFFFGLLWCGVMVLFTSMIVLAWTNGPQGKKDMPWFAPVIFGLFWLVGIGMLLGAINMGRRRAAIALVGGQLMAIQTGLFGSKKREWSLEDLQDIRVGPSGMEVNKQPINELQIVDNKNSKFGFLSERDDEELRWLAWELRTHCLPPERLSS